MSGIPTIGDGESEHGEGFSRHDMAGAATHQVVPLDASLWGLADGPLKAKVPPIHCVRCDGCLDLTAESRWAGGGGGSWEKGK